MLEFNFLYEIQAGWLNLLATTVEVRPYGKHADMLKFDSTTVKMRWDGIGIFVNDTQVKCVYPKRKWPNSRWPWPFRNLTRPTVVCNGLELYGTHDRLLFRISNDDGLPAYLRPGDSIVYKPGSIKITIK